jgi:23S rRNA (pseudouridine1915-N3)-methyltransferase
MKISLIAVGKGFPSWLETGYQQYCARLPPEFGFKLIEVEAEKRVKNQSVSTAMQREGERLLTKIPSGSFVVALDERGELWDTVTFSQQLKSWLQTQPTLCFLIGGADGFSSDCLARANLTWSLSRLTFPHLLVRLMVVEQLYRASTILSGHPYHRG